VDAPDTTTTDTLAVRADPHDGLLDVVLSGDLDGLAPARVDAAVELVRHAASQEPDAELRLLTDHPADRFHPLPTVVAARLGLDAVRDLHQLRRPLPVPDDHPERRPVAEGDLRLRPFDPFRDVPGWVATNNRAFAWHPDQGGRTEDQLRSQLEEEWVDLEGFLVLDDPVRPGPLAGSCWTRVHPATDHEPRLGEIYAIGVDPDHHGKGLGARLVLGGLDRLAERGIEVAMLYVESDNDDALRLYERLGFEVHLRRRIAHR
jgi:mycothiol synthase